MKVVQIIQQWLPDYRKPFFENLKLLGEDSGIDYQIFAGDPPKSKKLRGDQENSHALYNRIKVLSLEFFNREITYMRLGDSWKSADLVICEHAIRNINTHRWVFLQHPRRLAMWGHGRSYSKRATTLEERLKRRILKAADWFFVYTQRGADSLIKQGFNPQKISPVNNSTDTVALQVERGQVTPADVVEFKSKLGLGEGPICAFIGALDETKRLEFLFESARFINQAIPGFQLVIFGDGPQRSMLETAIRSEKFLTYGGRADIQTQALLSFFAELILMPGAVGLVAVDAIAMNVPIATTNWHLHGPEFEYLQNGINAIVTDNYVQAYADAVVQLLRDPKRLMQLRSGCEADSSKYSIEGMAHRFHEGVLAALELPEHEAKRSSFLDLNFPFKDLDEALNFFSRNTGFTSKAVHFINSYSIVQANSDPELLKILQADTLICDGTPLAKLLSSRGLRISPTRGPKFMKSFISQTTSERSHFFLGGSESTLEALLRATKELNPSLSIAGGFSPDFRSEFGDEILAWAQMIESSGASFVWVGLGTPKQDFVVHELAKLVDATFFAVGAAFDFLAETVKEAPPFLHNTGLEWVYRLLKEPRRLWKRYLLGNLKFIWICARELIRRG